jgi:hypothetical protein
MKLLISEKGSAESPSRDGGAHNMSRFMETRLSNQLEVKHPLIRLAGLIAWG